MAKAVKKRAAVPKTAVTPTLDSIYCGDSQQLLASWPSELVDCIVTSPPYWKQRDYGGSDQQLGQETSPADYVSRMVELFRHCRRVLKPTGTLWLVLGDKYESGRQLGLPWRVALALMDDDWILRSECIWHKPNAMPSPARSRPTVDHEQIFFLVRSDDYFYDADAIREPHVHVFGAKPHAGGPQPFWQARRHARTREKFRAKQLARWPLGSGVSSAGTQQTHRLDDSPLQISGGAFCGLSRETGRNLLARRLPTRWGGARPLLGKWSDGSGGSAPGNALFGDRLCGRLLCYGSLQAGGGCSSLVGMNPPLSPIRSNCYLRSGVYFQKIPLLWGGLFG